MSTKVLGILALAATACFLILITFQVMEMNKYSSASTPVVSASATAVESAPAPAAETPAPAAE